MNLPLWQSLWALPLHSLEAWCGFWTAHRTWWKYELSRPGRIGTKP